MNNLLNLFNCKSGKFDWLQWVASILLLVISIELIPAARADDPVLEFQSQKIQAVQLLKDLYLKFNNSVELSEGNQKIDIDLAVKRFEDNFVNKLETTLSNSELDQFYRALEFLKGVTSLSDPKSLSKKLIGPQKDQLSIELPENEEITKLAQNLIQSWHLSYKIAHEESIGWPASIEAAVIISFYTTFFSLISLIFFAANMDIESGRVKNTSIPEAPISEITLFITFLAGFYGVSCGFLSCAIKKSCDLKRYLVTFQERRQLFRLNTEYQALIDQESINYGIPCLSPILSELIDIRLLAQPAWNEDDLCPICLDSYSFDGQKAGHLAGDIEVTPCAHKFHKQCLKDVELDSFERGNAFSCPICRKLIKPGQFKDSFEIDFR